jgi:hypothetical protein
MIYFESNSTFMKKVFLTLFFFSMVFQVNSQSKAFYDELDRTYQDAINNGYTILNDGIGDISYDYGYLFPHNNFSSGNYYVTVVIDNCNSCNVEVIFENLDTGKTHYRSPDMVRSSNNISGAIYYFKQSTKGRGRVQVVLKEKYKRTAYCMLLKR